MNPRRTPWSIVALLCATATAGYLCRVNISTVGALLMEEFRLAIGAHTESPVTAAVSLALATALVLSVEGPFWATMIGIAGPRSGAAGGIMNMGSNLGGLVSPMLTPLLAQHIGWANALYVAAALSLVAAALWLGIDPEVGRLGKRQDLDRKLVEEASLALGSGRSGSEPL